MAMASSSSQDEAAGHHETQTQVGDLPEVCLAQVIALTSPRDAARCAAVSPAFCAAADSDDVWRRFLPPPAAAGYYYNPQKASNKDTYLRLCDAAGAVALAGGGCRMWLEKATGARCYALPAKALSLPWDDGEFSWRFTPHPLSRFAEVAELVDCTSLDIYAHLPAAAALTPATTYAAYLVYGTAEEGGHRGLSYPDQETAVAVGGRVVARHAVCLVPDDAEARKFRAVAAAAGAEEAPAPPRRPRVREDGWWEMEMGRLCMAAGDGESSPESEEVTASFEVLGWYPKRGLVVEAVEFRPAAGAHPLVTTTEHFSCTPSSID